ncbi:IclR family transcriptional regulator [Lacisediminihabitans sp. FW035]
MVDDDSASAGKSGNQYRIESLAKGLQVLKLFDENTVSLRLREICDRTGIPMPTAFRIVSTLEEDGFLDRTADGDLQPGVSVLTLGSAALRGSSLVQVSERPLRHLAEATGETVNLGILINDQVLYLARLRNADLVTANVQVGSTLPAVYTSMGKLLLAFLTETELDARIGSHSFLGGAGPNAVTSREQLDARLATIREQGYSIQDQELAQGLRSVSVPVYGRETVPVAAINIAVSSSRHDVESLRGPLLTQIRETAADISMRLKAL